VFTSLRRSSQGNEQRVEAESLARIPERYIGDLRLRVQAYRRIAGCTELGEIKSLRAELRDRYGKPPLGVELLLRSAEVRILAGRAGVEMVETREDKIILTQRGVVYQVGGKFPRLTQTKPDGKLTEIKQPLESLRRNR